MKTIFTCFLFLLFNYSFGQYNFVTHDGTNNSNEEFYAATQIASGKFISVGYTTASDINRDIFIVETDGTGLQVWNKTISSGGIDDVFSVVSTTDGGFAVSGSVNNKMAILKFNASGDLEWTKQYIEFNASVGRKLLQTNDGGYMIAGAVSKDEAFVNAQSYLVKTDASGNVLWAKKYFTTTSHSIIYDLKPTSDGNYIFLSSNRSENDSACIAKINSAGDVIWANYFADAASRTDGFSLLPTKDSGYLIVGNRYNLSSNGFALKLNAMGARIWAKTTNSDGIANINFNSSVAGNQGGYAIVGSGSIPDSNFYYAVNIQDPGTLIWAKTDRKSNNDLLSSIYTVLNSREGGYLAAGSVLDNSGFLDGMMMKLDFNFATCKPLTGQFGSLIDYGTLTAAHPKIINGNPVTSNDAVTITTSNTHRLVCSVLPLTLISLNATLQKRSVELKWQTAQESNTSYFSIEKSKDARLFDAFKQVPAAGNSNTIINYSAYDDEPFAGTSWYRLKMADKDGKYTYSNAVAVNNLVQNMVSINPNPASSVLNINVQSITAANAFIQITDVHGKTLLQTTRIISNGFNTFPFDVSHFAKGMYILKIIQNNNAQNLEWIKQ